MAGKVRHRLGANFRTISYVMIYFIVSVHNISLQSSMMMKRISSVCNNNTQVYTELTINHGHEITSKYKYVSLLVVYSSFYYASLQSHDTLWTSDVYLNCQTMVALHVNRDKICFSWHCALTDEISICLLYTVWTFMANVCLHIFVTTTYMLLKVGFAAEFLLTCATREPSTFVV